MKTKKMLEKEVFDEMNELIAKFLRTDLPSLPEELLLDESRVPLHSMHLQYSYYVDGDKYVPNEHLNKEQVGRIQTQLLEMAFHYLLHYAEFTAMKVAS